jgi:hypothetical protein
MLHGFISNDREKIASQQKTTAMPHIRIHCHLWSLTGFAYFELTAIELAGIGFLSYA